MDADRAQQDLLELMSAVSKGRYCAPWWHGLEYERWEEVLGQRIRGDEAPPEQGDYPEWSRDTLARLRNLSNEVGG
jgi:hypothetical protein